MSRNRFGVLAAVLLWVGALSLPARAGANCQTYRTVCPAGCDHTGVQLAVNAIPNAPAVLTGDWCIDITNNNTYNETVLIQNKDTNNFQIYIGTDSGAARPNIALGFTIKNASVTIQNLTIAPTVGVSYGILASSENVTISSVSIDSGGRISNTGILLSSFSSVSYSSVTVQLATGLRITGAYNNIAYSTMTSNYGAGYALYLLDADSNSVTGSYFSNPLGDSVYFDAGSDYNTIGQSSMTSNLNTSNALYFHDSDFNAVTGSYISNPPGNSAVLANGSDYNTIAQSTVASDASGFIALWINNAASNTVTGSYISNLAGHGASLNNGAARNMISASMLRSKSVNFNALFLNAASSNTVSGSYLSNPSGDAVYLNTASNYNTIALSSMTSAAAGFSALRIIASSTNTVLGSYIQGSTAAYVSASAGTMIGGSVLIATGAAGSAIWLDGANVNLSLATSAFKGGVQGAGIFMGPNNGGFVSMTSNTITGGRWGVSIATMTCGSCKGNLSITSMTFSGPLTAGATAINFTGGTFTSTFTSVAFYDGNIAVNVNSSFLATASTITMRFPSGVKSGQTFENDPNLIVDWYFSTPYPGCMVTANVGAGQDYSTIQAGLDSLPTSLPGHSCVVIRDGATYAEQVTVRGFINNGSSITIQADQASGLTPVVSPPAGSTAAFLIANSSVNLRGISAVISQNVPYGVWASSAYVQLSSVAVSTSGGLGIYTAGVRLGSWSALSFSTITAWNAHGLWISAGAGSWIGFSTVSIVNPSFYALYLDAASSNTVTESYISNQAGWGVILNGAGYNTISQSMIASDSPGIALYLSGSDSNTVTDSYISNPSGDALRIQGGSDRNTVSLSAMINNRAGWFALYIAGSDSNTVTRSYISNPLGHGAYLDGGADCNAISLSTMTSAAANFNALYISNSDSNTVTGSIISNASGDGARLDAGADYNTISASTMTSGAANRNALFVSDSGSNTVTASYIANPLGIGARLGAGAGYNTVSLSTIVSNSADSAHGALYLQNDLGNLISQSVISAPNTSAVYMYGSVSDTILQSTLTTTNGGRIVFMSGASSNVFTQDVISNASTFGSYGIFMSSQSNGNTISLSTVSVGSVAGVALQIDGSSANAVSGCYIAASTGIYLSASTGTAISDSELYAGPGESYGVRLASASAGLSMRNNTITANTEGITVDAYNGGMILLSSNSVSVRDRCGICVDSQTAATSVWITSNTVMPSRTAILAANGIHVNGLAAGATIQDNNIYYRAIGAPGLGARGLYASNSSGLLISRNRINQPGMQSGGSFVSVGFNGVQNSSFKFNDVFSSATAGTGYLLELVSSTVTVRNNIFVSSYPAPGDIVNISADSGFLADYNDYLNANFGLYLRLGAFPYVFPWNASVGADSHSVNGNPYWASTVGGAEDFHLQSSAGRFNPATQTYNLIDAVDSPVIDLADPAEAYGQEPAPNGGSVNMGSYGNTVEASKSTTTFCPVVRKVCKSDLCAYRTIQNALDAVPNPLTGHSCVLVRDSSIYSEAVTVQNFANQGSSLTIRLEPGLTARPVVSPLIGTPAAGFAVRNASVNIVNIDVTPNISLGYGILVSSPNVSISSVNVNDSFGWITAAGISISSWTSLSYSSVNVMGAIGLQVLGQNASVSYGAALNQHFNLHALDVTGASSASITGLYVRNGNGTGPGAVIRASSYTVIAQSTITCAGTGFALTFSSGAMSNAVTQSYVRSQLGTGISVEAGSMRNTISQSTAAASMSDQYALNLAGSLNGISQTLLLNTQGVALNLQAGSSNVISDGFIVSLASSAVVLGAGASDNTIALSTITSNSVGCNAVYFNSVSSNTISQSYVSGGVSTAVYMSNSSSNTISQSTITSGGGVYALTISGGGYDRIYASTLLSGARLDAGAAYNDLSLTSFNSNSSAIDALSLQTASSNTVAQCIFSNPAGNAIRIRGSSWLAIDLSSVNAGGAGLWIDGSSDTLISNSYITGSTAVYAYGASGAGVYSNTLVGSGADGRALWMTGASSNLEMALNTVYGGGAAGIYIDGGNGGSIFLSTNTIVGGPAQYALYAANQQAGAQIWITSNTVLPGLSAAAGAYGIYLNGLLSGATVQNNGIYYRTSGASPAVGAYGFYAVGSSGIKFDHNRISNPGKISGAKYVAATLNASPSNDFSFNDLYSTGTVTTFTMLQLFNSNNVIVKNNIFSSSMTATTNHLMNVDAGSQVGFASDYNDYFSSNSTRAGMWGVSSYSLLLNWQINTGQDANSLTANPLWLGVAAGAEDFHPLSTGGRWDGVGFSTDAVDSPTIDRGDVAASIGDETIPNGGRPNLGSYGQTVEASQSVLLCPETVYVRQAGGADATTIQDALGQISNPLNSHACVVIEDSGVYAEQVTVQRFVNNGSSITIMLDPAITVHPVIEPPAGSTAGFVIRNASVNIVNIDVAPAAAVQYGIFVSSPYVSLSSVNIDGGANIAMAGIALSSWTTVSFASVSVSDAYAFWLPGSTMTTVSYSTASNNSATRAAVYLANAKNNSLTALFASNADASGVGLYAVGSATNTVSLSFLWGGDTGASLQAGSSYNAISLSTMIGSFYVGLYSSASSSNTVARSYLGGDSYGVNLDAGSNYNEISLSTMAGASVYGFYVAGSNSNALRWSDMRGGQIGFYANGSDLNTVTQSQMLGGQRGAVLDAGSDYNAISFSSMTGNTQYGLGIIASSSNTVESSYIQGSTAALLSGSTGTVVGSSVLIATNTSGGALVMRGGGVGLTVSLSRLSAGSQGGGVHLDAGNAGSIFLSTNMILGGGYGVYIATQAAGTQIQIASNTIVPLITGAHDTYGLYLDGLLSGATLHNNAVVYRSPGSMGTYKSVGLYARSSSGLVVDHNRFNNPGMITGGSYAAVYLQNTTDSSFLFNDFNSTGTSLTDTFLIVVEDFSTGVTLKNNVFFSSVAVSGSSATVNVDADSWAGFSSNYNNVFSSNAALSLRWGPLMAQGSAWVTLSGNDADSISVHPRWFNAAAGVEDFHPLSQAGRWNGSGFVNDGYTAATIDAADSADATFNSEASPNGGRANQGSYGGTAEASRSPAAPASALAAGVFISSVSVSYGSAGANDYRVEASTSSDFSAAIISSATNNASLLLLSPQGLLPNTSYFLRAGAVWGDYFAAVNTVPASTSTLAAPPAPAAQVFSAVNASSVTLSWLGNGNPVNVTTYSVVLSTGSGYPNGYAGNVVLSTVPTGGQPAATLGGLVPNTTYFAFASAVNWNGVATGYSILGSTSTLAADPLTAVSTFTGVTTSTLSVIWSANGNPLSVTTYTVQLSTAVDFNIYATSFTASTVPAAGPSATFSGLSANTSYYFRVQAVNHNGLLTAISTLGFTATLASPPSANAPTFGAVYVSSVVMTWQRNGNPQDDTTYSAAVSTSAAYPNADAASVAFATAPAGALPAATIAALTPNTTYFAFAAAVNHTGTATTYTPLGSTATLAAEPLTAVTTFTSVGSSSFSVIWSANGNPLAITTYTVQLSTAADFNVDATSFTASTVPTFGPSATFTGLAANTLYFLRVRAVNHEGLYTPFINLGSTLTVPVILQAPVAAGLPAVNVTSITATWSLEAAATGYTLIASTESNNPSSVSASSSPIGAAATTATVTGLNANTTYYLFIAAKGPGASTAFTAYPATVTLAASPLTAVSTFGAVEITSMTVSWLANGNPVDVTTYTVVLSTGASYPNTYADNMTLSTMPAGAALSASFAGLNDNTLYYLHVAARNHAGTLSAYAALGSTVTRISPPTAIVFDEISSNTIVASAYAPTPLFSNLGVGLSGTRHAANAAAYQPFHGERWTSKTAMTTARGELAAAAYNGKVYVFGGSAGGGPLNAAEVYDPATNAWSSLASLPTARSNIAAANVGGKIYVVGGSNDLGSTSLGVNEEYDPETNTWAAAKASMSVSRLRLSAVSVGSSLYAFGGLVDAADSAVNERYTPASDSWTSRAAFSSAPGRNRMAAASVAGPLAGIIFAMGGSGPVADHYAYDPGADAWTARTSLPEPLETAGAASLGGKIYVIGGATGASPVYEYDPAADLWTVRAATAAGRSDLGVVAAGGRIYAVGGTLPDGAVNEEYDPGVATKFSALTPNTPYTFKAQARNQAGTVSPELTSVSTYTWAASPAASASAFTVVATDSVTFQWGANGNPGGTKYLARASTSAAFGGGAAVLTTDWGVTTSTAIASLAANTTYFFQVKARNEVFIETSYVSVGSTSTLAAVPASAPSTFSAVAGTSMSVSWLPNGNPVGVTTYTVVLSTAADFNSFASSFTVSTSPAGSPSASFVGLAANTSYYLQVRAINWNGVPSAFIALGATATLPSAPAAASPAFSLVQASSLTVAWLTNGNPVNVTTYSVVLSTSAAYPNADAGNTPVLSTSPAGAQPSAVFTGLSINTTYYAFAAALSAGGQLTAYTFLGSTSTLAALPQSAAPAFSSVSLSSFTASWNANGNTLSITTYTVQISTASDFNAYASLVAFSTMPAGAPSATFTSLLANTSYYFRVQALNNNGVATAFVDMGSTSTLAAVPASAASTFSAVMTSTLSVIWSANGNPLSVTTYTVQLSTAADFNAFASSLTFSTAPAGSPCATFTGLAANTSYYFQVRAVNNNALPSAYAALGSTATLAYAPLATAPAFSEVHASSVALSWLPNGNPFDVTRYSIVLSTGGSPNNFVGNVALSTSPAGASPSATIVTLLANTTYYAFAAAVNHGGAATAYTALGSTSTLAAEPATLVSTFANVASSSFSVIWSANGNPLSITTYTVQLSTAADFNIYATSFTASTVPASGPSATFTGLEANTLYYFRVAALNHGGLSTSFVNLGSTVTRPVSLQAPAPAGLPAVNISSITATWALVSSATGYTLIASTEPANPPSVFASSAPLGVGATTATVVGLSANTTYYLFIQANGPGIATSFAAYPATATLAAMPLTAVSTFGAVEITSMTVSWLANGNPVDVTTYTVVLSTGSSYPNSFADNRALSTMPAGAALSASFAGLNDNTLYYLHAAARNHAGTLSAYAALGSTITRISPPTGIIFDEISSNTIVASAYAPTPLFSNLGVGQSGTRQANGGSYDPFHGEQWTSTTSMPSARRAAAAAGYNGKIYVFGGYNGGTPLTTSAVYDPATAVWTNLTGLPSARGDFAAAGVNGKIYVVGGSANAGATSLDTTEEYDPAADSWATGKAAMPSRRSHLSAVAVGGKVYAFGGMTDLADSALNEQYDPASNQWTSKAAFASATGRSKMAAAAASGTIFALGGSGPLNDTLAYAPDDASWTARAALPAGVETGGAASLGGKIYVIGGALGAPPVYEYDPAADRFVARAPMITGRTSLAVAAAGGRIYAMGGKLAGPDSAVSEQYDPGVATQYTGLTPNTQYTFKAQARNQAGTVSPELTSVSTYTWAAPPGASASAFTFVAMDSVTFQWGANGNPGGTQYRARASTSASFGGGAAVLTTDWGVMTSTAISSLSANTTYFFQAQARNAVFIETAYVSLGSTSTLAAAPAAAGASFSSINPSSMTVTWLANGNPLNVTTYTVVLSTGGSYPNSNLGNITVLSTSPAGAAPTATVPGLAINTTYFAYVAALNANGVPTAYAALGSTSTMADLPLSAVSTFSAVGLTELTASWEAGGNAPSISSYTVQLSTAADFNPYAASVIFSTVPAGAPTATFTGLNNNTTYYFRVRAINNNGVGTAYVNLGSTLTLFSALAAPSVVGLTEVNLSSMTAAWGLSATATGYTLVASVFPNNPPTSVFASSTTMDINALQASVFSPALNANTTYYLFVRANGLQTSSLYASFAATSTLAAAPATAASTFSAVAASALSVNWSANGNPAAITTYTVALSTAPDFNAFASSFVFSTAPAGAPNASFAGLAANTTYYFRVQAVNHNGVETAFVGLGSTITLAAVPAAAAAPFGPVDIASMTVSWLPNGNPVDVTTYSVVLSTGGSYPNSFVGNSALLSTAPAGILPTASFTGLAANTTYFAFAAAQHRSGGGTAYVALGSTVTLADAPAAAAAAFSAVAASSLTVSWSAAGNPLSITTYTVQLSTAADFNAFASSIVFSTAPAGAPAASFTGLTGLTTYYFRVGAVNHNGVPSAFVDMGSTQTLLISLPVPAPGSLAMVGVSSIAATWGLSAGATGYTLLASTLPANPPLSIYASSTVAGAAASSASIFSPALSANTTYYLFVRANGDQISSAFAAYPATSTLADVPAAAAATFVNVAVSSFSVLWSANGNPLSITTYTVQLSTAADFNAFASSVAFSTVPAGAPSATFTGLNGGTTYYLRVRAVNHNSVATAFFNAGSTQTVPTPLFATITNAQSGDLAWRRSNSGLYSVFFGDVSGSHLDKFQVKASTSAGGLGNDLTAFTDVVTGLSPGDSYNAPWALPAAVFNSLLEGVTNYITVKVFNGLGNTTLLQDAFYVLKDTTAPSLVNAQSGDTTVRSVAGASYSVAAFDAGSALAAFQYSVSLTPASGNAGLVAWTDIAAVANSTSYTAAWPVNFAALASGTTNYVSVRAWDAAGTTTTLVDAFYVLKDTAGPSVSISSPTNAAYLSSLPLLRGAAASIFGVQGTEVSVLQGGLYWNPASSLFNSAGPVWMAASGAGAWTLNPGISWADGGTYQVVARSSTTFNAYSTTYATATFTLDSSTPTVAVASPVPDSTVSTLAQISGTAADPGGSASGLASVEVRLRRNSDGQWWNWFTQAWSAVAVSTIPSNPAAWSLTPSSLLRASLADGASYFIAVRASDNALPPNQGDFFVSGATFTWQDAAAPSAVADLAAVGGPLPGQISLSWTAAGDDAGSGLILTGQYRLFYSTDAAAIASTSAAQIVLSTAMVSPGDAQFYTLISLSAGVTYYLQLALADGDGNWSSFSNQASTVATPAPYDTISGHVVNLSTQGITAVQVDCWNAAGALVATTFTVADGSGTYSVSGLSPGSHKLKVTWTANGISSSLWQDGIAMGSSGVDFVLEINYALATLTGTLATLTTSSVGGAAGLSAAGVHGPAAYSSSRIELYQGGRQVAQVRVQPSGRWTIPSLLPGKYAVRAFTGLSYTGFQDVELTEGEYKVLGFVFDPLPEASVFAFPNPARTVTTIRFVTVLAPLEADILIFDIAGNVVREFPGSQINAAAAPIYRVDWDLNNSRGQAVASGVYTVMVKIRGGSDNQTAKVIKKVAVVR